MSNGYSEKLIAIDDEMAALGRPLPPVVSWLSGGTKGDFNARTRAWHEQLEAWENANPEAAIRWHELRAKYVEQDKLERRASFGGSEADWDFVELDDIGVPSSNLDLVRLAKFNDNASIRAARNWMLDGTTWSLTLIGQTGCGKSTAAALLAHQLLQRRFRPAWVDCVKQCEAPMYGVAAEHTRWKCRTAGSLVLDDLGSGKRERTSDVWMAWLDDVIGSRANDRKKTIITTNRSEAELLAWLGARLMDRLRAGAICITKEPSMRGLQATQFTEQRREERR